ncbi:MAG: GatB/YqeY domain-containing protein, partial [Saprospiraceae bacterium]
YIQEHQLSIGQFPISRQSIITLLSLIIEGKLSVQQGQEIWNQALLNSRVSMEELIQSKLHSIPTLNVPHIIEEIFTSNPEEAREFKNGKKKLLGFFLGEIKRKYPGVNIKEVQEILSRSTP